MSTPFPPGATDITDATDPTNGGDAFTVFTASPTSTDTTSTSSTSAIASGGASGGGSTPTSATLLFGFLIIFVALFSAFLLLGFLWQYQRRRRAALAEREFHERRRILFGTVPKLWEVWIQDEPSRWEWDSIRPLSVDVDRLSSCQHVTTTVATRPRLRPRLSWFRNPFHRRPIPQPQLQQQEQQGAPTGTQQQPEQPDDTGAEAREPAPISGVTMSFVIAMPHAPDVPNRPRSAISQISSVAENWRRGRDFSIGIYHPPFREGLAL